MWRRDIKFRNSRLWMREITRFCAILAAAGLFFAWPGEASAQDRRDREYSLQLAVTARIEEQGFPGLAGMHIQHPADDYQVITALVGRVELALESDKGLVDHRCTRCAEGVFNQPSTRGSLSTDSVCKKN